MVGAGRGISLLHRVSRAGLGTPENVFALPELVCHSFILSINEGILEGLVITQQEELANY